MKSLVILGLFTVIVLASAKNPKQCVFCDFYDGTICNVLGVGSPHIVDCEDTTDELACYSIAFTRGETQFTERSCTRTEKGGTDFCSYYNDFVVSEWPESKDFKCKLCSEDLCNVLPMT